MNHQLINRQATRSSRAIVDPASNAGFQKVNSDTEFGKRSPFLEDFNMEHTFVNVAGVRNALALNPNSPSCVYFG